MRVAVWVARASACTPASAGAFVGAAPAGCLSGAPKLRPRRIVDLRYAWPSGDWGSLPIEGGVQAAYKREIEAAPDPAARRREIEERLQQYRSPFRTAEAFGGCFVNGSKPPTPSCPLN